VSLKSTTKTAPTKTALGVQIRWMIRRDMAEVLQIERSSFEYHWTEADFLYCLRQRNCIGMVAEHGSHVVGFMIYELYKNRLHILNFAVAPEYRHNGVGLQMIEKLINKLAQQRREYITLEVRETNLQAQMFFRSQGFQATRVLRDHYQDTSEDAYVMQFALHGEDDGPFAAVNRVADYEEA
jgi:ribosomal-protein-alanine N-acetyltransferase